MKRKILNDQLKDPKSIWPNRQFHRKPRIQRRLKPKRVRKRPIGKDKIGKNVHDLAYDSDGAQEDQHPPLAGQTRKKGPEHNPKQLGTRSSCVKHARPHLNDDESCPVQRNQMESATSAQR
ncbi:hypothetical protein CR513_18745, partial [Mucuna pruriens]